MTWGGFWKVGVKPLFQTLILLFFKTGRFVIQMLDLLTEDLGPEEGAGKHSQTIQHSDCVQRLGCDSEKGRRIR